MKKLIILIVLAMLFVGACGSPATPDFDATAEAMPTQTPYPTYTVIPSPTVSPTPESTATPTPLYAFQLTIEEALELQLFDGMYFEWRESEGDYYHYDIALGTAISLHERDGYLFGVILIMPAHGTANQIDASGAFSYDLLVRLVGSDAFLWVANNVQVAEDTGELQVKAFLAGNRTVVVTVGGTDSDYIGIGIVDPKWLWDR